MYIDFDVDNNGQDTKIKVGDQVSISKYKNIFAKSYSPNLSKKVFIIKKVNNTEPSIYVNSDLNGEEIVGIFYEKELKKKNQTKFRTEKVIGKKRKVDKLCVKSKGYDNPFNSWFNVKDIL